MKKTSKGLRAITTFPNDKIRKKGGKDPQWFWNEVFKKGCVNFFAIATKNPKLFNGGFYDFHSYENEYGKLLKLKVKSEIDGYYPHEKKNAELLKQIIESFKKTTDLKNCELGIKHFKRTMLHKNSIALQDSYLESLIKDKLKRLNEPKIEKIKKKVEDLKNMVRKCNSSIDYELIKKLYPKYYDKYNFVKQAFKGYLLYVALRCTGKKHNEIIALNLGKGYSESTIEHFRARYNKEKDGKKRRSENEWKALYYQVKKLHVKKVSYNEIMEKLNIGKREYVAKFIKMESYTPNWRKIIL